MRWHETTIRISLWFRHWQLSLMHIGCLTIRVSALDRATWQKGD